VWFRKTFEFEHEYLWNGWRYRQAVNGIIKDGLSCIEPKNFANFGPPAKKLWALMLTHPKLTLSIPHHRRAVAQPCVNGDRLNQCRMAKFDPTQIRNPWANRHKIWNRWLRPRDDPLCKISCKSVLWGLLGKWVKYNENFSSIYIPFLLTDLQVRPPDGFSCAMAWTTRSHARVRPFREPKFEVNIDR